MGKYKYILFDLDGTLTASAEGIVNSIQYALEKRGTPEADRSRLEVFVGPPLTDSFQKYYGMTQEEAWECVQSFRERYTDIGWKENRVYDGIPEILQKLRSQGKHLYVATAKPEPQAIKILNYFGLAPYFDFIGGATLDTSRIQKSQVIGYVLDQIGREHLKEMVMVGDRENDVAGAAQNGIPCVGVLYGYGDREELETAGAAAICPSVKNLPEYL